MVAENSGEFQDCLTASTSTRRGIPVYENIRFRLTNTLKFSGAHIRIGYNHPGLVNNINFRNVWMGENQLHSVAIYGQPKTCRGRVARLKILAAQESSFTLRQIKTRLRSTEVISRVIVALMVLILWRAKARLNRYPSTIACSVY